MGAEVTRTLGAGINRYTMVFLWGPTAQSLTTTSASWSFRHDNFNFNGGGDVPPSAIEGLVVPWDSTLVRVYYKITIGGTLGTAGENFTHKISKNEVAATSGATGDYSATTRTVNESGLSVAFAAGDRVGAYIVSPATLTTNPTGVRGTATLVFTIP